MSAHRFDVRRGGYRPPAVTETAQGAVGARGVAVEESIIPDVDELPLPAGFGEEVVTSSQDTAVLAEYEPPSNSIARLDEVSISLEANGRGALHAAGTTWGPWTGATSVTVPFDDAVLLPGYGVRVTGSSTDGNETTIRTTLSAGEV